QPVTVDEPSRDDAITILTGLKGRYEEHHHVEYTEDAVRAAVDMSSRYITDRFLPDKAIDLLDQAGARVSLTRGPQVDISALQEEEAGLEEQKAAAITAEDYEEAARVRDRIVALQERIEQAQQKVSTASAGEVLTVDEDQIADVVSRATGVPV